METFTSYPTHTTRVTLVGSIPCFDETMNFNQRAAVSYNARRCTLDCELLNKTRRLTILDISCEGLINRAIEIGALVPVPRSTNMRKFTPPGGVRAVMDYQVERRLPRGSLELCCAKLIVRGDCQLDLPRTADLHVATTQRHLPQHQLLCLEAHFCPHVRIRIRVLMCELLMCLTHMGCLWPIGWNEESEHLVVQIPRQILGAK